MIRGYKEALSTHLRRELKIVSDPLAGRIPHRFTLEEQLGLQETDIQELRNTGTLFVFKDATEILRSGGKRDAYYSFEQPDYDVSRKEGAFARLDLLWDFKKEEKGNWTCSRVSARIVRDEEEEVLGVQIRGQVPSELIPGARREISQALFGAIMQPEHAVNVHRRNVLTELIDRFPVGRDTSSNI